MIQVFDIEARNWNDFQIGGALTEKGYQSFPTAFELYNYMQEIGGTWYAHAGGRYDFRFFMKFLKGTKAKVIIRNSSLINIRQGDFILQDSYALLPFSLKKLGENFETKHQKTEFDFEVDFEDKKRLIEYNENDCYVLAEVLTRFEKEIGQLRKTISSQAMKSFTEISPLKNVYREKAIESDFREAYYGGRVEVFKRYGKNIKMYDVNSMYGSVMRQPLPCSKCLQVRNFYSDWLGIYEIEWECFDGILPVLPIREDGMLIFRLGTGHGWYTSHEIELAKEKGYKIKVIKGYIWLDQQPLLKEYVEYWYQKRLESKTLGIISKLMINSLYGRFGIREIGSSLYFQEPKYEDIVKGNWICMSEEDDIWAHDEILHLRYVYPQLSAFITSYARITLYHYLENCENSLYYCDTDSFVTDRDFPVDSNLGGIKIESKGEGIFIAPKLYSIKTENGNKIAAKGFYKKQLNHNSFEEALAGNTDALTTQAIVLRGMKESLVKDVGFLTLTNRIRSYSGNFLKRQLMPNGIDTKPFISNG